MPSTAVCEELIQGYFHYVHPVLPIIDAPAFIDVYEREGIQGSNLLLIWSIFHAGASVSASVVPERYMHQLIVIFAVHI